MAKQVRAWQDDVVQIAKDLNIDLVRTGISEINSDLALAEFMAERRLRNINVFNDIAEKKKIEYIALFKNKE